jgi:transposase
MQAVTTIGLDIAKSVFQVHGVDAHGKVVVRRQLKRRYVLPFFKKISPCLVGIEACATSQSLVAAVAGTRSHRPPDASGLREALSQAAEERCCRCGGDLRSRC